MENVKQVKFHIAYAYQPKENEMEPGMMSLGLGIGAETITYKTNNAVINEKMLNDARKYIEEKYNLEAVVIINAIQLAG